MQLPNEMHDCMTGAMSLQFWRRQEMEAFYWSSAAYGTKLEVCDNAGICKWGFLPNYPLPFATHYSERWKNEEGAGNS